MTDSIKSPALLEQRLGLPIDPVLLEQALTHRSFSYENGHCPTNERLEFLGDSVLGLVVTSTLYHVHPDLPEGQLAKFRSHVVNSRALAEVGRGLELGDFLRLGKGEEATGGRDKSSILADTVEAVIGAVYLDHDLDTVGDLIHRLFDPLIEASAGLGAGLDWKTSLQELTAEHSLGVPGVPGGRGGPGPRQVLHRAGPRGRARPSGRAGPLQEDRRADRGRTRVPGDPQGVRLREGRTHGRRNPSRARAARTPRVPELPEVEVVRRGLDRWVVRPPVTDVEVLHPRAIRRHAAGAGDFAARLAGSASGRRPRAANTSGCRSTAAAPCSATSA